MMVETICSLRQEIFILDYSFSSHSDPRYFVISLKIPAYCCNCNVNRLLSVKKRPERRQRTRIIPRRYRFEQEFGAAYFVKCMWMGTPATTCHTLRAVVFQAQAWQQAFGGTTCVSAGQELTVQPS
jgi:hypothetical protein